MWGPAGPLHSEGGGLRTNRPPGRDLSRSHIPQVADDTSVRRKVNVFSID